MTFPKTDWGDWKTDGLDQDQVHEFFQRRKSLDWVDVENDAELIVKDIAGTHIPDLYGNVISGVAAQSSHGAFALVGAMLGLDPKAIEYVVEPWKNRREAPNPITFEEFLELYRQAVQHRLDIKYGFKRVNSAT